MINVLHLLWIVPAAASAGAFVMAIFKVGDRSSDEYDEYGVRIDHDYT